jgi:hypothetical protein
MREDLGIRRRVLLSGTSTRSAPAGRRPPKPSHQIHSFMKKNHVEESPPSEDDDDEPVVATLVTSLCLCVCLSVSLSLCLCAYVSMLCVGAVGV